MHHDTDLEVRIGFITKKMAYNEEIKEDL